MRVHPYVVGYYNSHIVRDDSAIAVTLKNTGFSTCYVSHYTGTQTAFDDPEYKKGFPLEPGETLKFTGGLCALNVGDSNDSQARVWAIFDYAIN